jgi:hypothetical protein
MVNLDEISAAPLVCALAMESNRVRSAFRRTGDLNDARLLRSRPLPGVSSAASRFARRGAEACDERRDGNILVAMLKAEYAGQMPAHFFRTPPALSSSRTPTLSSR